MPLLGVIIFAAILMIVVAAVLGRVDALRATIAVAVLAVAWWLLAGGPSPPLR